MEGEKFTFRHVLGYPKAVESNPLNSTDHLPDTFVQLTRYSYKAIIKVNIGNGCKIRT